MASKPLLDRYEHGGRIGCVGIEGSTVDILRRPLFIFDRREIADAGLVTLPSRNARIDVHGTQARHFLLPGLSRFLETYPGIRLHIGEAHQALDMVREGFDCILRAGILTDSPLIQRKLAELNRGTFASPTYIERFGEPRTPDDLGRHQIVGLFAPDAAIVSPLSFVHLGKERQITPPPW